MSNADVQRIKSLPLYPATSKPFLKNEPPEGCAIASRVNEVAYLVIAQEWPAVAIGEEIEIETTDHWIWRATVEEIRDAYRWVVRIVGEKRAMPLPPLIEGEPYVLPYMSGDAWSTRPEKGRVLTIGGQHYKVTHKPLELRSGYAYRLTPVSGDVHAKRPGRIAIKDYTDPNPSSYSYYRHNVGRTIQIGNEWLHIEKVQRVPYGDAEGLEVFGYSVFCVGHFVPETKAKKLQAAWDAKAKVRSLEFELKVAKQDLDYGGNPDAVPGLEAALAEARKALPGTAARLTK